MVLFMLNMKKEAVALGEASKFYVWDNQLLSPFFLMMSLRIT